MSTVLDASALLAFVQDETGAEAVEAALVGSPLCSTANWSEVAQKVLGAGRDWQLVRALLISYDIELLDVTVADAEWAARRWRSGEGFSLADRLCLALGDRMESEVLTADSSWGSSGRIRQIR